jgi:hypothetical protein
LIRYDRRDVAIHLHLVANEMRTKASNLWRRL